MVARHQYAARGSQKGFYYCVVFGAVLGVYGTKRAAVPHDIKGSCVVASDVIYITYQVGDLLVCGFVNCEFFSRDYLKTSSCHGYIVCTNKPLENCSEFSAKNCCAARSDSSHPTTEAPWSASHIMSSVLPHSGTNTSRST